MLQAVKMKWHFCLKFFFGVYSAVRVRSVSILRFALNGTQGSSIDQDSIDFLIDVTVSEKREKKDTMHT
jgi:hypothetical protein